MLDTYVVGRLRLWAEWRLRRDDGGLGYPRNSAFAKTPGSGFWSPEMDSAAGEMDQCVCALKPEMKMAVMLEFTKTGTQQQKAQQCGCCLRTYQYRLEAAYRELLGFLNDQAAGINLPSYEPEKKKDIEYA